MLKDVSNRKKRSLKSEVQKETANINGLYNAGDVQGCHSFLTIKNEEN